MTGWLPHRASGPLLSAPRNVIPSGAHKLVPGTCHDVIPSAYHAIPSVNHDVVLSAYHNVILSAYHNVILSAYHNVILSEAKDLDGEVREHAASSSILRRSAPSNDIDPVAVRFHNYKFPSASDIQPTCHPEP